MALDWDKLRVFHTVTLAGSFTRAGQVLNISQSAISRQISILEEELGTQLFERVPRGLVLTKAGHLLNGSVTNVFGKVAMTEAAVTEAKNVASGHLRVSTTLAFGTLWLAPRLQKFLDQYPNIRIDLMLTDEEVDLNMREADIGITALPLSNADIIHTEPVSYKFRIYASPEYLKKFGTPKTAQDLDNHQLIVFGKEAPHLFNDLDWLLKLGSPKKPRTPYYVVNSAVGILEAVKGGLGIGNSHKYIVGDDPGVVEILPGMPGADVHRYVVYPKQLAHLKRVQVFVDFLLTELRSEEL